MNIFEDIGWLLANRGAYFGWGILSTIVLSLFGTIIGLLLGMFLAVGKTLTIQKRDVTAIRILKKVVIWLCTIYSLLVRGTPLLVQALLFKYGTQAMGINWNMIARSAGVFNGWFYAGLIVMVLNCSAYMCEIVISGLNGIEKGQYEAAYSLGLKRRTAYTYVIMPQALKNCIPTIGNEWIANIKESSILNVIGVTELFFQAGQAAQNNYRYMATYIIIAVIYLMMTLIVLGILKLVGIKLSGKQIFFHFKPKEAA